jgi:hypothetical protein
MAILWGYFVVECSPWFALIPFALPCVVAAVVIVAVTTSPVKLTRACCSGRRKRKRNTLLPLLEHAVAYVNEFRVRFHVGVYFL